MEITNLTAQSMAKKIMTKELSPVEVVQSHLERIKQLNPKFNLFITIFEEEALKEARGAEEELMKSGVRGPLHGIPIALKDLTPVTGRLTTFGSPIFKDHIAQSEPTIVKRIRDAGAIIIGKTNTPEFGHKGTTDNLLAGPAKNPWDSSRTAGGSSGGSAAAVASKCVPLAEGSDGGGSIRIPSSLNGIIGLKPTFGRIPFDSSPINHFGTTQPFVHYGPMARSAEDAALLLSVMEGYEPNDPYSVPVPESNLQQEMQLGVKGKKFAYTEDFGLYPYDPMILVPIEEAISILRDQGAIVEKIPFQFEMKLEELISFFNKMWFAGLASAYGSLYDRFPSQFSSSVSNMIEAGRKLSAVELRETEMKRTQVWNIIQKELNRFDAILSPVVGVTAFSHQIEGPDRINGKASAPISDWMMTQLYNCTGHPAISIPVGLAPSGLPVGLQAASKKFNDSLLLRIAHTIESEKGFQFPNL
ncbi:amidase [Guptibacillus hwajinpoensis]|uniref:amidase n=1 Tax=Guptibacillus hwajinpoensis TaxID=208199 RepID=UPI00273DAC9C|nr:amidase [Pseudalkalibacillus hwajinpoensis]WLR60282.1 amidase [Pseudalkalibacillus hwajinpoensis]